MAYVDGISGRFPSLSAQGYQDEARGRTAGGRGTVPVRSAARYDVRSMPGCVTEREVPQRDRRGERHPRRIARNTGTDTPWPCLIAGQVYGADAFRDWLAPQGLETVIMPARARRTNGQPPSLERYLARHAVARSTGGLQHRQRGLRATINTHIVTLFFSVLGGGLDLDEVKPQRCLALARTQSSTEPNQPNQSV